MLAFSLRLVRPYARTLLLVALAMVAQTLARLAAPWTLKLVLDSVLRSEPVPRVVAWVTGDAASPIVILQIAVVATLLIAVVEAGSQYLNAMATARVGQRVAHDLRQTVYAHLQRLSLAYHDRQQVGPLISTITEDIKAIQDFASQALLLIVVDTLTIVGVLAVMFSLSWSFTLVALSVTPLVALFALRLRRTLRDATRDVRRRQSEIVSIVQEGLGGIRVVKAFAQGPFERQRLDAKSLESVEAALRARRLRAMLPPVVTLVVAAGTAGVLWFGARLVLGGAMTAGELVVFLAYLARLFAPIQQLARASTELATAAVGMERVMTILDADERLTRAPEARTLDEVRGRVELDHVTFGYQPGRHVLHDVSLVVEPGQMVGLVGPSGSGKSTLVSLIPRFYDVTEGAVRIDGHDVRSLTVRSLRQHVGFVLQETQLFRGTVAQNVAYGRPDATRAEIEAAARAANAHELILALPDGYDTVVGEGGLSLSGGQRQRIGIARAMIRGASILVLDEPSSALDAESERLVFEALRRLMTGKTTFVIAHRLATVKSADVILVLDGGRIVERGRHEELVAAGGLYARLQREQLV